MNPLQNLNDLPSYVREFCETENLPAISVAIHVDGKDYAAASGVLNANTGVEATADSIFQIGSITKVLTASVVMRLIDRGLITLEQPVSDILKDFRLLDKSLSDQITLKHLLTHTSGIPGDLFDDDSDAFGRHIKTLVERCPTLEFVHRPGEYLAYSNTAFAIAGRVIEVVLGKPWEQAIIDEVYAPLGMTKAVAYPRDSIRYRAAMGHFRDTQEPNKWVIAPKNFLTLGMAPAGTTLMMTASDLLTFAAAHVPGQHQSTWLSSESRAAMQTSHYSLPIHAPFNATDWGLGWFLSDTTGTDVIGHDGATLGQVSLLRVLPDRGAAIAILLNAAEPSALRKFYNLSACILGDHAFEETAPVEPPNSLDLSKFAGRYETVGSRSQVSVEE